MGPWRVQCDSSHKGRVDPSFLLVRAHRPQDLATVLWPRMVREGPQAHGYTGSRVDSFRRLQGHTHGSTGAHGAPHKKEELRLPCGTSSPRVPARAPSRRPQGPLRRDQTTLCTHVSGAGEHSRAHAHEGGLVGLLAPTTRGSPAALPASISNECAEPPTPGRVARGERDRGARQNCRFEMTRACFDRPRTRLVARRGAVCDLVTNTRTPDRWRRAFYSGPLHQEALVPVLSTCRVSKDPLHQADERPRAQAGCAIFLHGTLRPDAGIPSGTRPHTELSVGRPPQVPIPRHLNWAKGV